ncbi:MAG: glycosyltransferase family 2 protein [Tannerella sp.]|jgi:glycosyltransferase involved in cell wall biosynthesis|nr:glycosyltransferase family 2 protein [Tannerella sp.]
MKVDVIISTYNQPRWLQKTLWGYANQSCRDFGLLIADDGSDEETRRLIESFRAEGFPLRHIWHPDEGFRKTEILNKAVLASAADYLIFTDQDCVPRSDFVATHLAYAEAGRFLSGGYFRLPGEVSKQLTHEDIASGRAFAVAWLVSQGVGRNFKMTKLFHSAAFARFMNAMTPTRATWNGCNASCFREDLLAVNGFNEQMRYGGEDREFGERMSNRGIRGKQLRYSAVCLHLYHERPYKSAKAIQANDLIRKEVRRQKVTWTPYGIVK